MKFGYARVSTSDQKADLQVDALLSVGVERGRIYIDVASGRRADRPALSAMLKAMREGDKLVVWRLDRIGRSAKDLLALVENLPMREVVFSSLHERIETKTASGKLC